MDYQGVWAQRVLPCLTKKTYGILGSTMGSELWIKRASTVQQSGFSCNKEAQSGRKTSFIDTGFSSRKRASGNLHGNQVSKRRRKGHQSHTYRSFNVQAVWCCKRRPHQFSDHKSCLPSSEARRTTSNTAASCANQIDISPPLTIFTSESGLYILHSCF
jgi:hypothetical protein